MKRKIFLLAFLFIAGLQVLVAQQAQVRKCTEQDLPGSARPEYVDRAKEFIRIYYDQLLLNVGDVMVQEAFAEQYLVKDAARYQPEFLTKPGTTQHLTPKQYLQELDKTFQGMEMDNLSWEVTDLHIPADNFYMLNLVSCYVTARYNLTLRQDEQVIFARKCEAYCLFPKASVSIQIKLMQVNPMEPTQAAAPIQSVRKTATRPQGETVEVTADMLPLTDNKPRVVVHHPDLDVQVTKVSTDNYGFWVDATLTNQGDNDIHVTINTGLRAYDDAGTLYREKGRNNDMRMYVGKSTQPTNWNAQQQKVDLPAGVPVKVRILTMGLPKAAKGILRLDWAMYSEDLGIHPNDITVQLFDLYPTLADKQARPVLPNMNPTDGNLSVRSMAKGLSLCISKVRKAGDTCIVDAYVCNQTTKDGNLSIHTGIKVYDDQGNIYEGKGSGGQVQLYVGKDKLPANWDAQTTNVCLPPGIPVKVKLQIKGLDSTATGLSRIQWYTISEHFGTRYQNPTFVIEGVAI